MPSKYTIPAHERRVCEPCEFHRCIRAKFAEGGPGTWREYLCTHPEAFERTGDPARDELSAIENAIDGGRFIGRTEKQPDWCPLLRAQPTKGAR